MSSPPARNVNDRRTSFARRQESMMERVRILNQIIEVSSDQIGETTARVIFESIFCQVFRSKNPKTYPPFNINSILKILLRFLSIFLGYHK